MEDWTPEIRRLMSDMSDFKFTLDIFSLFSLAGIVGAIILALLIYRAICKNKMDQLRSYLGVVLAQNSKQRRTLKAEEAKHVQLTKKIEELRKKEKTLLKAGEIHAKE